MMNKGEWCEVWIDGYLQAQRDWGNSERQERTEGDWEKARYAYDRWMANQ